MVARITHGTAQLRSSESALRQFADPARSHHQRGALAAERRTERRRRAFRF
jgi:hypothetical protein